LRDIDPHQESVFQFIVFDLDGTLVDSSTDLANATNALVEELGGEPLSRDAVTRMVGEGAAVLVRRALAAASLDPAAPGALDRFLALYDERSLDYTVPYDGIVDTLAWLAAARKSVAVLTNKPSRAAERLLEGLGLRQHFSEVIGGDTPCGRKPDPAGLLHLVAAAGVKIEETLLVGDSPIDLQTARRAGSRVCLARFGFGYRFADGDFDGTELFIDDPHELVALLSR
jgi:phosphoglycolate phosphatase